MTRHIAISYKHYHDKYQKGDSRLDHNILNLSYVLNDSGQTEKYLENQKLISSPHPSSEHLSKQEWVNYTKSKGHADLIQIRQGRQEAMKEIEFRKIMKENPEIRNSVSSPEFSQNKQKE